MTYEKSNRDAASVRVGAAVPDAVDVALGGRRRTSCGSSASGTTRGCEAQRQGAAGELEPNEVVQPENEVQDPVPDIKVRQYFIRAGDRAKRGEVQALVRRLQRMDVEVRRLARDAVVDDYKPYGRRRRRERLDRGDYVVSMDQRQKHWVQAMLNEDTYTPFPYFYDVTGVEPAAAVQRGRRVLRAAAARVRREAVRPASTARRRPRPEAARSRCTRCRSSSRAASSRPAGCASSSTSGASATAT